MDMALTEARAAGEAGEVPVGCVVVRDGAVVARAGNRTLTERDPTAHAELVAIRAAAAVLGSERLDGCDLYVTLEPCAMCAGAVAFARIRRLYYGAADPKGGAIENGVKFFASPSCHHRPEVYGGLAEVDALALLEQFFRCVADELVEPFLDFGVYRLGDPYNGACRQKLSVRKLSTFGRITRSGAAWPRSAATMVLPMTNTVM